MSITHQSVYGADHVNTIRKTGIKLEIAMVNCSIRWLNQSQVTMANHVTSCQQ